MKKMQKLAPKMNAIRDKYKKAKTDAAQRQKMNEEIMKLYQAEGYNPMSGCFPILLQLPILVAFYNVLSRVDRAAPRAVRALDPATSRPSTTRTCSLILMIVSMYVQQAMTPTTADPAQKKIFMAMPLLWGFFLKDMPSGLVLYWLFSQRPDDLPADDHQQDGERRRAAPDAEARRNCGRRAPERARSRSRMRFEGKSEQEAIETALKELKRPAAELRYHVVRDEKSFWGGRVVEIEVEVEGAGTSRGAPRPSGRAKSRAAASAPATRRRRRAGRAPAAARAGPRPPPTRRRLRGARGPRAGRAGAEPGAMDDEAFAAVEATLDRAPRRRRIPRRDAPPPVARRDALRADRRRRRAAARQPRRGLERPRGPDRAASPPSGSDAPSTRGSTRKDFARTRRNRSRSSRCARPTRPSARSSPQLLPPLSPGERRLVHLALAEDPDVETESEGDGFLKRVAVRPRAS